MNSKRCRDALKQLEPTTKDQGSRLPPSKVSARHTAHQHCPFSPGSSIICLFLNLCAARAGSHAVPWFPLTHFKPDLQLLCLFTPEPSPAQGPASRCVMLPCAQRNGVKPWKNLPGLAKPLLQPDPLRRNRLAQFGVWFFLLPQQLPLSFNF